MDTTPTIGYSDNSFTIPMQKQSRFTRLEMQALAGLSCVAVIARLALPRVLFFITTAICCGSFFATRKIIHKLQTLFSNKDSAANITITVNGKTLYGTLKTDGYNSSIAIIFNPWNSAAANATNSQERYNHRRYDTLSITPNISNEELQAEEYIQDGINTLFAITQETQYDTNNILVIGDGPVAPLVVKIVQIVNEQLVAQGRSPVQLAAFGPCSLKDSFMQEVGLNPFDKLVSNLILSYLGWGLKIRRNDWWSIPANDHIALGTDKNSLGYLVENEGSFNGQSKGHAVTDRNEEYGLWSRASKHYRANVE